MFATTLLKTCIAPNLTTKRQAPAIMARTQKSKGKHEPTEEDRAKRRREASARWFAKPE